jgi:hypothetical protein
MEPRRSDRVQTLTIIQAQKTPQKLREDGVAALPECDHLNWPRLAWFSSRILAPPGW